MRKRLHAGIPGALARPGLLGLFGLLGFLFANVRCVPDVEPGQYQCDPATGGACPAGMICQPNGILYECHPERAHLCGDGVQDIGEQCDRDDLHGTCADYGFAEGNLQCTAACTALCTACGNGTPETGPFGEGEGCDDGNLQSHDGCSARCRPEEPAWSRLGPGTGPGVRQGHALVYDPDREVMVLFGGVTDASPLADTWEFDGSTWARISTRNAPAARYRHALAYDAARERVVLYGGTRDATDGLDDTWEYDGADWLQVDTPHSPGPRFAAAAAFDPDRKRVVLFGGIHQGGDRRETWEYDGADWTLVDTEGHPGYRHAATLTYVPPLHGLVLFGGSRSITTRVSVNDTWLFADATWQELTPSAAPPPREAHAAFYDPLRRHLVVVGGITRPDLVYRDDAWEFDGVDWSLVDPADATALEARAAPGAYLDHAEGALVFGGATAAAPDRGTAETWWLQYRESVCGNGRREPDEICDGDEIAPDYGLDCVALGFSGGTLGCRSDCRLDLSGCID